MSLHRVGSEFAFYCTQQMPFNFKIALCKSIRMGRTSNNGYYSTKGLVKACVQLDFRNFMLCKTIQN